MSVTIMSVRTPRLDIQRPRRFGLTSRGESFPKTTTTTTSMSLAGYADPGKGRWVHGREATYLIDSRSWQIETNCAAEDTAQTVLQLLFGFRGVVFGTHRPTSLLVRLGKVLGFLEVLAYRRRVGGGRRRRGDLLRDAARRCRLVARVRHVACFGVFP